MVPTDKIYYARTARHALNAVSRANDLNLESIFEATDKGAKGLTNIPELRNYLVFLGTQGLVRKTTLDIPGQGRRRETHYRLLVRQGRFDGVLEVLVAEGKLYNRFEDLTQEKKEILFETLTVYREGGETNDSMSDIAKSQYGVEVSNKIINHAFARADKYFTLDRTTRRLLKTLYGEPAVAFSVFRRAQLYVKGKAIEEKVGREQQGVFRELVEGISRGPDAFLVSEGLEVRLGNEDAKKATKKRVEALIPLGQLLNFVELCIQYTDLHNWTGYSEYVGLATFKQYVRDARALARQETQKQ